MYPLRREGGASGQRYEKNGQIGGKERVARGSAGLAVFHREDGSSNIIINNNNRPPFGADRIGGEATMTGMTGEDSRTRGRD